MKTGKPSGPVAPPGTTWPSALAILLVLAVTADAAYLLYAEWQHFSNPDMGTLVVAAALVSLALCAPYSLFTRRPREALLTALLALACVAGAHALLLSGRLAIDVQISLSARSTSGAKRFFFSVAMTCAI